MKKILLASTMLVGTAGFAAADNANFTFSGEAYMGLAYSNIVATVVPEVTAEFTAGMSTTTDMGLEAGAEVTITAGGVSMSRDFDETDGSFGDTTFSAAGISDATVYLSGDWGKLEAAVDVTASDVTFTYSNTWGDFDLEAYYVMAPGVTNGDLGGTATYTMGDYSVWVAADYDASATTTTFSAGAEATFSGFTISAEASDLSAISTTYLIGVEYSTGAYTIGGQYNAAGDYELTGSYDLGGGVSVDAGFAHNTTDVENAIYAGVSMSF